jgi:S-formylglutathione hydrolase FrmB
MTRQLTLSASAPLSRHARAAAAVGLRWLAFGATVVVAVLAGIGWLYLLRDSGLLAGGPALAEALPLQRLAGDAAQPLSRIAVAWLPTGAVAGALLARAGFARRALRSALLFAGAAALLIVLSGVSDAITESDPLGSHLGAQPGRAAIWTAAALLALGAALPRGRRRA